MTMTFTTKTGTRKVTELQCPQAKPMLSPYLDGVVTGTEMLALERHMSACADCNGHYSSLRNTQRLLASAGRPKAPADLGLKLRLAISREVAQSKRPPFEGLWVRLENSFRASLVPATAGFLSALVIFGIAMAYFVVPSTV